MNDRNNSLLNNTIIIAIGTFSTKILSFLLVPFYTIWLSPEEYGNFDLLITYVALIIPFITFQLEQSIFRYVIENKNKEPRKYYYYSAMQIILTNILICNVVIYLLLRNKGFYIPFMLYFNFYALFTCISEYVRGTGNLKLYSLNNILVSVVIVILNILLVYIMKLNVNGMLLSYAIAYGLGFMLMTLKEKTYGSSFFKDTFKKEKKEMLKYSLPLIPNSISWWITNVSDRTIINFAIGSFYNGIYAVSCKIPTIVNLLFSVFNLSWQQSAIESLNDSDKKNYYNKIYNGLITFLYSSSYVIIAVSPIIFRFFIDSQYKEGLFQIPLLLNGVVLLSLGQFLSGIFLANKDTKNVGISTTVAAIINLIVNLVLIKAIGLYAASFSTLLSYFMLFIIRFIKLKNYFEYKAIIKKIILYNLVYILFALTIVCNNMLILFFELILTIIIFLFSNKKIITMLLKKILRRN